ncbi:unnamed protein product [Trichogramma brassicae]|uniref:Mediator of RNA polymerase II transcription subunit 22 n=1 Tax=Trichogramma brassicae TaxID=86971 RepID=A0A6H5J5E9_9HYME|nr:unnamed protein product [Trichogramma brassicae]
MSSTRTPTQSKEALLKSYSTRLKEDIKSMLENFEEILKLAKIDTETNLSKLVQCEQEAYEMQVRAANMVRAGESLLKLVSDIKQYLILNDFLSQNECDQKLANLRDDMATELYDLEEEYFTSVHK